MSYYISNFKEYTWKYIKETHSSETKVKVLLDFSRAKEFRIHITLFPPGAGTEEHTHEWEHAMYVMQGRARAKIGEEESTMTPGVLGFIPRDTIHSIENIGQEDLVVWGVSGPPRSKAGYDQLLNDEDG